MKIKVAILIYISLLLVSCAPATATQESQVDDVEVLTEATVTEVPATQEPIITEAPVATESPTEVSTEVPTEAPLACVTLMTPVNGAEIPPVGKVTFSWTPMDEAGKYVLNIILPSGEIVPFETDQTFRNRYMEAFVAGGEYQWQVIAQGKDGGNICISEVSNFNKPVYEKPKVGGAGEGGSDCLSDGTCSWGIGGPQ